MMRMHKWLVLAGWGWTAAAPVYGALSESQVLVVYNSAVTGGDDVYNYYKSVRPGVVGLDLNDATLGAGNISYANYETQIASKVRNYLTAVPGRADDFAVITLTKGIPHRIQDADLSHPNAGDDPSGQATNKTLNNLSTYATVDSELTLVLQDLRGGNPAVSMGTKSNNLVTNPYYNQTASFSSFNRALVDTPAAFVDTDAGQFHYWSMTSNPGYMYMTTRLDGYSFTDVKNMIDRSLSPILYNSATQKIVIDANGDNLDGNDYANTASALASQYANVSYDNTGGTFYIGNNLAQNVGDPAAQRLAGQLAALISYGGNHSFNDQTDYLRTWDGQIVDGAIMSTLESYNARDFGGVGGYTDQGQLALWLELGGTFGVGNAWEPFAFSLADNSVLLPNFMFNGLTWAEAAWSSIPFLSWQQVVIGDPLATASVPEPAAGSVVLACAALLLQRRRRRLL